MSDSLDVDVLIVGGGPAGLSAALNLGRSRASVAIVDADRPRNAATLRSHGFLTRDGVPPHELRRLAREEIAAYPAVHMFVRSRVDALVDAQETDLRFAAAVSGRAAPSVIRARAVLVATGLRETLPDVPNLRGFYGVTVFSCAACDAWELQDEPLVLFGETDDIAARARLIARWTTDLTVCTNGSRAVSAIEEAALAAIGVRVRREPIAVLHGDRGVLESVEFDDGSQIAAAGGFARPAWHPAADFLDPLDPERDADGHLVVDRSGRTSIAGVYAAGDAAAPGPQQLIVAAGHGARAAAVIVHDAVGVVTAH